MAAVTVTADDLRQVGYTVDDTTTAGTWVVSGLARTWTFPADDQDTARQVYGLALTADNIGLRTQAEEALAGLDAALGSWDSLTDADFRAAVKNCAQIVANLTRLTIRHYS